MRCADPTEERVVHIAHHLRAEDRIEVWLSHRATGTEAVLESWADSDICRCIETSGGEPVGLTGVCGVAAAFLGDALFHRERYASLNGF